MEFIKECACLLGGNQVEKEPTDWGGSFSMNDINTDFDQTEKTYSYEMWYHWQL